MAVSDNLCAGDSYFVAELKSLRRLLACAQTGTPCLCFIDEILKGTNTVERIAASRRCYAIWPGAAVCASSPPMTGN